MIGQDGRIVAADGNDVTEAYRDGARIVLQQAARYDCGYARLTDEGPSCGDRFIYDGSFQGRGIDGEGVTAALLRQHGIAAFPQAGIPCLAAALDG